MLVNNFAGIIYISGLGYGVANNNPSAYRYEHIARVVCRCACALTPGHKDLGRALVGRCLKLGCGDYSLDSKRQEDSKHLCHASYATQEISKNKRGSL